MTGTSQGDRVSSRLPAAFTRLLYAWFASLTADGIRFVALPLLALATRPTPAAVATVAAATALPWLVVALPAGAIVDRLRPVTVIWVAHLVRGGLSLLLMAAVLGNTVGILLLCAVGFGLTSAETFADGAAQTLVVTLVPEAHLDRANSRFVSSETVALDLAGPLLSGVLFTVAHWLPFLAAAGGFTLAAILAASVRTGTGALAPAPPEGPAGRVEPDAAEPANQSSGVPAPTVPSPNGLGSGATARRFGSKRLAPISAAPTGAQDAPSAAATRTPIVARIGGGFRVLFGDPVLRLLVLTVSVMAAANAAMDGVLVVYATDLLHLSPAAYPTLLATYSLGTLLAATVVATLARRFRTGALMMVALAGVGGTMLLMGLVADRWVAWASFAVMGVAGGTWNVLSASRRQRRTPLAMMARVSSAFRVIAWGVLPVGAALGGLVGQQAGVQLVFVLGGGTILLLGCLVARSFWAGGGDLPVNSSVDRPDLSLEREVG